jgi:multidrug resistance efflux pump
MPSARHGRTGLSLIPRRVSGQTHVVASPVAAAQSMLSTPTHGSSQETAPLASAAPRRGFMRETMVGVGSLPESAIGARPRDRGFLKETVKFGSPASSEVTPQRLEPVVPVGEPRAAEAARRVPAAPPAPAQRAEPARRIEPEVGAAAGAAGAAGLFRTAAVDARRADALGPELAAHVKGKSWSVLLLILSLVTLAFIGAGLASVEVTAEAQGVLRAPNGLRPVASALAGAVTDVQVQSGDAVEQGQIIAHLEATDLRASLTARERELELVREDVARSERHDEQLEAESARALARRRAALRERIEVNAERRDQRQVRDQSVAVLVRDGGASRAEGLAAKEALQDATLQVSSLSNELALLDLEIADRARQAEERRSTRKNQLGRAEASLAEARTLLGATEIRAPASGRVESLLVPPGAVLAAGGLLGHIVPSGSPRVITAFVPSREIAFVSPGAPASVEVQSLSVSEFGLAQARVTRVSADVATAVEVQSALNEVVPGSFVRVELELCESSESARMAPLLRSGERVKIRLHRRERRLITLLFDFVQRWVQ